MHVDLENRFVHAVSHVCEQHSTIYIQDKWTLWTAFFPNYIHHVNLHHKASVSQLELETWHIL